MKNIIAIIAFALFAGTFTASAQEGKKTATKKESCCATAKACTKDEKAKCLADASCTHKDKAKCMAEKAKKPAQKGKTKC
jgi:Ni/Co efflux regulator RcnB